MKQISQGVIEIHYVAEDLLEEKAATLFDTNNVNLEISFVKETDPVRTVSGKVNLLIK